MTTGGVTHRDHSFNLPQFPQRSHEGIVGSQGPLEPKHSGSLNNDVETVSTDIDQREQARERSRLSKQNFSEHMSKLQPGTNTWFSKSAQFTQIGQLFFTSSAYVNVYIETWGRRGWGSVPNAHTCPCLANAGKAC